MSPPKYPMRLVTRRTGLTSHLIRAWERRHNAVKPMRTETNRRLYSDEDIERLILLRNATGAGHSISQIATLSREDLERLVASSRRPAPTSSPSGRSFDSGPFLRDALAAVTRLDADRLEDILARAIVSLGQREWMEDVIVPFLQEIGARWEANSLGVAHEHLASAVIRTLLGNLKDTIGRQIAGPRLLLTTPAGQLHELGALLATVTAASEGWNTTYLGPNLPASEIVDAVRGAKAQAVGLSILYANGGQELKRELSALRRELPPAARILVGGRGVSTCQDTLTEINATVIANLEQLRNLLQHHQR